MSARFQLTDVIMRVITDTVSGEAITIGADKAEKFDEDYQALMHAYHDSEDTVLAILWHEYKTPDSPDVIRYI